MPSIKPQARLMLSLLLLLTLWACASVPPETGTGRMTWQCDAQGDSAVHQEDWQRALRLHEQFLAAHPDNCLAIYHLGYIWSRLGDRDKEITYYERAAACGYDRDDQLYFNLGMAYGETDQMGKAIAAFQRAVAINPDNADDWFGLGLTARSAGRPDLARQAFTKAVTLDSRHWDARIELARVDLDEGLLDEARIQLEAVQKGAPEHEELQGLWRIYHDRRMTLYDSGK